MLRVVRVKGLGLFTRHMMRICFESSRIRRRDTVNIYLSGAGIIEGCVTILIKLIGTMKTTDTDN